MAAVADVTGAPPASWRNIAASLARARSRLAPVAADAVLCVCLANIWLFLAGAIAVAVDIGLIACGGEACPVAVAGSKLVSLSEPTLFDAVAVATMLFINRLGDYGPDEEKQGHIPRSFAAAGKELQSAVILGLYACAPFFALMVAGVLLMGVAPVKGSRMEAIGSVIGAVGWLGKDAVACFIPFPLWH